MQTISVTFDEDIWERAYVRLPNSSLEKRLLIYSYFNGVYEGEKSCVFSYIEWNILFFSDFSPFNSSVTAAEIIYCDKIGSWVFTHPFITASEDGTKNGEEENECSWLLRSPCTQNFDILSLLDGDWKV